MGDITKNFSRWEFECDCGCGLDMIDIELVKGLQQIRDYFNKPVHVNSGCRCLSYNRTRHSKDTSQHVKCKAADIHIQGVSPRQIAQVASVIPIFKKGGIGLYHTFVHLDTRDDRPVRWKG